MIDFDSLYLRFLISLWVCAATARGPMLDVPFVKQIRNGCGSAAVAMVMQYWIGQTSGLDPAASAAERVNRYLPATRAGLSGSELGDYLEANGFTAYLFTGELDDLRNHLAKGRPVIVCLGPVRPLLHFVVLTGIDETEAIFNDPARGKSVHLNIGAFLRDWKASRNWALLAVPRQPK